MATTTEITPAPPPAAAPDQEPVVPELVLQLQDDLERSRRRESYWMSLAIHMAVVVLLATSPKWGDFGTPIPIHTADDLIKGKDLTYLELPPDAQKLQKRPETNVVSDKDRIATTKRPTIDQKTLDDIRNSARRGTSSTPGPTGPEPAPGGAPAAATTTQGAAGQLSAGGVIPPPPPLQQPKLVEPSPPLTARNNSPFGGGLSPRDAINQAMRSTRPGTSGGSVGSGGGGGGDYGAPGGSHPHAGNLEILSDTMGVDFSSYLQRVLHDVRINWYNIIPEAARPPLMKRGKVAIEFVITKDGRVQGMQLTGGSGDTSLDRAAWGGIIASDPFPPLPSEFKGPYIKLRFRFYYNPGEHDME